MIEPQIYKGISADSERILYSPSSFARESLFFLQETGILKAKSSHSSSRQYLDSFLLLLVLSGSGTVNQNGAVFPLRKGDCAFLNCIEPYSHHTNDDPWTLRWVHFNGSNMSSIHRKFLERSGSVRFSVSDLRLYTDLFQQLYDSSVSDSYVRDMEIHQAISFLLTAAMKDCWNTDSHHIQQATNLRIEPVRQYLFSHYKEKISLEELSSRFFISKFYLSRLFREQYGMSVSDYILDLRIRHAKELLRFSALSLNEIAEQCGFYDLPYFSRTFKKAEGISPSAYRKQWI